MRKVTLTDEQLRKWNHLRDRAGEEPVTKEIGEGYLARLPLEEFWRAIDRLGE